MILILNLLIHLVPLVVGKLVEPTLPPTAVLFGGTDGHSPLDKSSKQMQHLQNKAQGRSLSGSDDDNADDEEEDEEDDDSENEVISPEEEVDDVKGRSIIAGLVAKKAGKWALKKGVSMVKQKVFGNPSSTQDSFSFFGRLKIKKSSFKDYLLMIFQIPLQILQALYEFVKVKLLGPKLGKGPSGPVASVLKGPVSGPVSPVGFSSPAKAIGNKVKAARRRKKIIG